MIGPEQQVARRKFGWPRSALLVIPLLCFSCGGRTEQFAESSDGASLGNGSPVVALRGDGGTSGSDATSDLSSGDGGSAAVQAGVGTGGEAESGPVVIVTPMAGGESVRSGGANATASNGSSCPSASPAVAPLRRLTHFEYDNTVRDVLRRESNSADALPPEVDSLDAANDYLNLAHVEGYHQLAHHLALDISEDPDALEVLLDCSPTEDGEDACLMSLFDGLLPQMLRRPLTSDDGADFQAVFDRGAELGEDFASGVRAVLEVALQSPEFLYMLEFGQPVPERGDDWAGLTPYELAARLSYLYWGSAPDTELLEAAAQGELSTTEEVSDQASRLLDDQAARRLVRHFYSRLLGLQVSGLASRDDYPGFTTEVSELMVQGTERYIDAVTWEAPGDFRELMTSTVGFVNEPLAAFYAMEDVTGDELKRVEFDPEKRAGILTQPSLLASQSFSLATNPIRRGHFVRTKFLCSDVPPEPDIPLTDIPAPDPDPPPTTRERYARHAEDPLCAGCHSLMDPIGFGFGNYDAAGLWQDTENGYVIDASGEIIDTDAAGTFVGAVELAQRLAESEDARRCYVENWMDFAYRRSDAAEDGCTRAFLNEAFLGSDGSVRELLLALSQTEAFLYRPASEVAP